MLCDSYTKVGGVFSTFTTVLLAILYQHYTSYVDLSAEIPNILNSLRKAEQKVNGISMFIFCKFGINTVTYHIICSSCKLATCSIIQITGRTDITIAL